MENSNQNFGHANISLELGHPKAAAVLLAIATVLGATAAAANETKAAAKPASPAPAKMEVTKDEETDDATAKAAAKPASPAKAAAKPASPAKAAKPDFDSLDGEGQLEAIKTEVTKHTKKGKSADIKALLAGFGVTRASELTDDQYGGFYNAVVGYGTGESVEALIEQFAGDGDLT